MYNAFEIFEDSLVSNFCCTVLFLLKSICFCSNSRKVNRLSEIGYIYIFCTIFQDYKRWGHEHAITGTFLVFGMEMLVDVNHTLEMKYSSTTQNSLRAFILFPCPKLALLRLTLIYRTHKHTQTLTKDWLMDVTFIQHKQTRARTAYRHCDYSLMLAAVWSWWLNSSPAIAVEILSLGCPWN